MFSQKAFLQTLLFFAIAHLAVMTYIAATTKDYEVFNVFRIIGLDTFFPHLADGKKNFMLSLVFAAGVYLFVVNSQVCLGC